LRRHRADAKGSRSPHVSSVTAGNAPAILDIAVSLATNVGIFTSTIYFVDVTSGIESSQYPITLSVTSASPPVAPPPVPTPTPPVPPATPPPGGMTLGQLIAQQAQTDFTNQMSSYNAPGTLNGYLACAWAVNQIPQQVGLAQLGTNPLNVASVEAALQAGRGTLVSQANTLPGDIDIQNQDDHIGICMNSGCTLVYSNSSSGHAFIWPSAPWFPPSYPNLPPRFYRVLY